MVNYSRSIILTKEEYLDMMAEKTARRNAVAEERRKSVEKRNPRNGDGKQRSRKLQLKKSSDGRSERRKKLLMPCGRRQLGLSLENASTPLPNKFFHTMRELQVRAFSTPVCRSNMRIAVERRRYKKVDLSTKHLSALIE